MSAEFLVQDHRIGRYILKAALGEGGYGQIYLACQDNATDEPLPCVLKFSFANHARDEQAHRRVLHEARLAARLGSHPNVVHVMDVGVHEGMPFIVMEYVDGADLEMILALTRQRRRRLSLAAIYDILASVATGLRHAHAGATIDHKPVAIIHRDVKPANILISRDGITKLTDFGIGVALEDRVTGNHARGTPRYMSPEHVRCEVGPGMDIYGLGVVAWELVENRVYREESEGLQHYAPTVDGHIPPLLDKTIPPELVALIVACLDPNPKRRPTASEFVSAVSRCPGYSRDPEVLKHEIGALIGTLRRSGASQRYFAAPPELVATFAVLAHPLAPVAPAWSEPVPPPEPVRGEATLEVEADAPRMQRRSRFFRVREATDVLSAGDAPPVDHAKTPVVAPPWFEHERHSGLPVARGVTESAPAPRVAAQPSATSRGSLFIHTFVSVGAALMAAGLAAYWVGSGTGAPVEVVMAPPAVASVVEAQATTKVTEAEPEARSMPDSEPSLPSLPGLAEAAMPVAPLALDEPPPPIEPTAASQPSTAPAEPSRPPKRPARPKPTPRVPVTLALSLITAAEIQIGNEVTRLSGSRREIEVPAGTHRVRWRQPDEREWRDVGRKRFEPRRGYFVRLSETGAEVIELEERGKP